MRFEGTLKTWDDDQASGTIEPQGGGQALFVRISAFPGGDAQTPYPGESLSFEVELSPSGRKQAVRVRRLSSQRATYPSSRSRSERVAAHGVRRRSWMVGTAAAVLLTTVGGLALMRQYEPEASARFSALSNELSAETAPPAQAPKPAKAGSKSATAKPTPVKP